jgi:hypothetical protein
MWPTSGEWKPTTLKDFQELERKGANKNWPTWYRAWIAKSIADLQQST